ncbi:hypothetical protein FEM03_23555 [Phragmitibacter flavus]|uniref:Lipoprotein n=1 Tax=Phragmitibacter flavus TaxID=2576071 RepID=A0A5R8K7G2_9BACT|nr:hypothetical protein [Phragmitibacter flavus]TLD68296.1 hypothetical protein FEM03_23555 [Phragmitibacter flavus]
MFKLLLILLACLPLTSCGGFKYAVQNYRGVKVQKHHGPDFEIRVFDKPEENRMMVTPTVGRAAKEGYISGATLGLASIENTKAGYQKQAQDFLDHNERKMEIYKGDLVVKPQWEFWYRAKGKTIE